ncbi:MAG: adenylate kinase [Chloroflexi bacterium]|nr:adenylate kinase [Chloroflexota bacterium]
MHVVLIGPPGAGKGTQAARVASRLGIAHIASGDMFREAVANRTPQGVQAKAYIDRGELVPDDVTVAMVMERLEQPGCREGAILDGFPRTLAQAQALDRAFREQGTRVERAIYLCAPTDELLRRLAGRWLCRSCQAAYHEVSNPPKVTGQCDRCGGELYQRDDDSREVAQRRFEVYLEQTAPVIDFYRAEGVLDELDGARGIDEVTHAILQTVRRACGSI